MTEQGKWKRKRVELETGERRLEPRLRMLKNATDLINNVRSSVSTTVVSDLDEDSGFTAEAQDAAYDLVAIQEPMQSQLAVSATQSAIDDAVAADDGRRETIRTAVEGAKPQGERPKSRTHPATRSWVNVYIDGAAPKQAENGSDRSSAAQRAVDDIVGRLEDTLRDREIPGAVVRRGGMIAATMPLSDVDEISGLDGIDDIYVSRSEPLKLDLPAPKATTNRPEPFHDGTTPDGSQVIIGIIDVGGYDFAHDDFIDDGKTRFLSIWDQGGTFRTPPDAFGYGSEIGRDHMQHAIDRCRGEADCIPPVMFEPQSQQVRASHGTHVASIAAGKHGVCPKADIAAVLIDIAQPNDPVERRRQTFSDSSRIIHAIEYLVDVANAKGKPISINISLGTNGGPHDGSNATSRWIDLVSSHPRRAICVAAGNSGQEAPLSADDIGFVSGRIHTSGRIEARGLDVELGWVVVGNGVNDVSENELEIWYGSQDQFSVTIKGPDDDNWYEVQPGEFIQNLPMENGTILSVYNELYHPTNGDNYIAIYQSPNLDPDSLTSITPGLWRVRLRGEEVRDGTFHAWLERDDPAEIGRIDGERYFRFPSFFTEQTNVDSHSVSSLACTRSVITVGNLNERIGTMAASSSQGPTRDDRHKPDVVAPGTDIVASRGFGTDDDEPWVAMTGTSMASPYVAGVIGLMLHANENLTSAQCRGIILRTSQPLPGTNFDWRNDAGYGLIQPDAAIREARNFNRRTEIKEPTP